MSILVYVLEKREGMMKDLKEKLVLITGGAMGMGRAMAERFLDEGARVVITDINQEALDRTVKKLSEKGEVRGYISNVSKIDDMERLKERVHSEMGKVDVLVNNAGIVLGGTFWELTYDQIKKIIDVDLYGVVFMTRIFIGDLLEKGEGHIVNLASAAGLLGVPRLVPYCTSKFGVVGFSESLRLELEALGYDKIKVTAVCPSYVSTGMFEGAKPPKFTRFIRPETMGRLIVEAVKEDKPCLMVPYMVKLIPFLKSILPVSMLDRLNELLGVSSSMEEWKGRN